MARCGGVCELEDLGKLPEHSSECQGLTAGGTLPRAHPGGNPRQQPHPSRQGARGCCSSLSPTRTPGPAPGPAPASRPFSWGELQMRSVWGVSVAAALAGQNFPTPRELVQSAAGHTVVLLCCPLAG